MNYDIEGSLDHDRYVLENLIDEAIVDVAIDLHWHAKMLVSENLKKSIPKNGILDSNSQSKKKYKKRKKSSDDEDDSSFDGRPQAETTLVLGGKYNMVQCPVCLEAVGGGRFAPHLEKCLKRNNRGKNGKSSGKFAVSSNRFDFPAIPTKERKVRDTTDPFPDSMIVKVRLRDGEPFGNSYRIGISLEEFNASLLDDSDNSSEISKVAKPTLSKATKKPSAIIAKKKKIETTSPELVVPKRKYKKRKTREIE